MADKPKAKGLVWRKRKSGEIPMWIASAPEYEPRTANLEHLLGDDAAIIARCDQLNAEMLVWVRAQKRAKHPAAYDGTFGFLIQQWMTDPDSPFHGLKPSTREVYAKYARPLKQQIGQLRVDIVDGPQAIDGRHVARWFRIWAGQENLKHPAAKLPAAHICFAVLKDVVSFGVVCRNAGCAAFITMLRELSFPKRKPREFTATAEMIVAKRQAAHRAGHPLRALCYALQFETNLRQWDVIGVWVPLSDWRPSAIINGRWKWIGPTWSMIDQHHMLKITPDKTEDTSGIDVISDLTLCPMVMEELTLVPAKRRIGPLIINEKTGLPYQGHQFRRAWRADAKAAGWPENGWNRDIRASAYSEARKGNAGRADLQKVMGHTSERMGATVYDREALEAQRRVASARASARAERPENDPLERFSNGSNDKQ